MLEYRLDDVGVVIYTQLVRERACNELQVACVAVSEVSVRRWVLPLLPQVPDTLCDASILLY